LNKVINIENVLKSADIMNNEEAFKSHVKGDAR